MSPRHALRALLPAALCLTQCKPDPSAARESAEVRALQREAPTPALRTEAVLHERSGRGRVRYLGADVAPASPSRGDVVEVTHYFQVEHPPSGEYDVFVHGDLPGGAGRVLVADHAPVLGRLPTQHWQKGDVWADPHRVKIPSDVPAPALELYVGLFKGDTRWTVEAPPGGSDGQDRVRVGLLRLSGAAPADDLPEVAIPRASGPIVADGVLDEAAWAKAPVLTFSDTMGRGRPVRFPTKLRLLWDDQHLYVAFEATDEDITERYSKRDDPIYEHETVELFLMPNVVAPALGPYVELQASPGGVIFDASFDGRRQGMNTAYEAGQTVGTKIDGTLDIEDRDRGWVSEWAVPFAKIRGVSGPPKDGDEWRMNAFRIEKFRVGGRLEGEYTAWSPPQVGDFHNTARFGRMKFVDAPAADAP